MLCYCVQVFFERLVSAFSTIFFVGVKRSILKSGMLFALVVSEPFKSVWGVMEESDVDSLSE